MNIKTLILFIIILIPSLIHLSCNRDCVEGQGSTVLIDKTPRQLQFDKIELSSGYFDVDICQDSVFMVELKCQPNLASYFDVYESNGILFLNQNTRKCIESNDPLKVIVHFPYKVNLTEISHYGSGLIRCSKLETSYLYLKNVGSGDIQFSYLYADNVVEAEIKGSGSIWAGKGTADRTIFTNSGYGNINADDLICGDSRATINGSGNIYVYALHELDANISGSGSIFFRGGPHTYISGQGTGELIQLHGK